MKQQTLIALVLIIIGAAAHAAPPARAQIVMPQVTVEQVRNAYMAWCLTNQMDLTESESNRVACTKPVSGGRGFMIQALAGNGAAPLVRLEIAFAQNGTDVIATAKQQLETQRADGAVHREDFKQREVIAGTQSILDEVAASLQPKPIAAPNEPSPEAAKDALSPQT